MSANLTSAPDCFQSPPHSDDNICSGHLARDSAVRFLVASDHIRWREFSGWVLHSQTRHDERLLFHLITPFLILYMTPLTRLEKGNADV